MKKIRTKTIQKLMRPQKKMTYHYLNTNHRIILFQFMKVFQQNLTLNK